MRAIRRIAVVGASVATVVGVGLGMSGTALADPSSTPTLTTLVGVGSDTITPEFAGSPTENTTGSIVTDYNATSPTYPIASWDAVSPSTGAAGGTITAKASGSSDTSCAITRPDGSSAGITTLNAGQLDSTEVNINGTEESAPCVDYARSSRAPNTTTFDDTFVAQEKDAIAWGYPVVSGVSNPQPAALTQAQLVSIYTCTVDNWNQVGSTVSAPIIPVIPQAGSGTRATFLGDLGITASSEPCWVNGTDPLNSSNVIEENTGLSAGNTDMFDQSSDVFSTYNDATGTSTPDTGNSADVIYPYSVGDWIAQGPATKGTGRAGTTGSATVGGHASSIWGHGDITLAETLNPANNTDEGPTSTNSSGQPVINPNFSSQFFRTLYVVVRNGFSDPTSASDAAYPTLGWESAGLQAAFGKTGWSCTNETAQADEIGYGFTLLGANCGALQAGD